MKLKHLIPGACVLAATAMTAAGQQAAANGEVVTIPKQQYEQMLQDQKKLMDEMKEMKAFKARFEQSQKESATRQKETDQSFDEQDKQIKEVKALAKESFHGSSKFLVGGYGTAGFTLQDHGGNKQFSAAFNPLFLWKLNDRLLFEGELEAQLAGNTTAVALEMAQLSYVLNDYMSVGAGKFLNPMNYFVERQHMNWVNKMPDKPLAVYDGLLAETELGLQLRGGVPVGPTKLGYAFYVANAPQLRADPAVIPAMDLGTLEFNNFDNVGNHIAVGGRLGFLPIPEVEVGYGFQFSNVAPPGNNGTVDALLQSVDLTYIRDSERLKGLINFRAQWVWSRVGAFTYDPAGLLGGPFSFSNNRDGGYFQIAYRPTRVANRFIQNLEPVLRYDRLSQSPTATGFTETRYSVGLNYWLAPSSVFKMAYEFDQQSGPLANRRNAVLMQFVLGF